MTWNSYGPILCLVSVGLSVAQAQASDRVTYRPSGFLAATQSTLQVSIPVLSLHSGKSKMDAIMHDTLLQKDYPDIIFVMDRISPAPGGETEGEKPPGVRAEMTGKLNMAGKEEGLSFPVWLHEEGPTRLTFTGQTRLNMSQFGMVPPRALFGALRTANEVTILFTWTLQRENE
jgi:polyisoprenoid-binding protein YceI